MGGKEGRNGEKESIKWKEKVGAKKRGIQQQKRTERIKEGMVEMDCDRKA